MKNKADTFIKTGLISLISITAVWLIFKFFLPVALPFLVAYMFSALLRPVIKAVRRRFPLLDKPFTLILVLIMTALFFWISKCVLGIVLRQLEDLVAGVSEQLTKEKLSDLFGFFRSFKGADSLLSRLGIDAAYSETLGEAASEIIKSVASSLSSLITGAASFAISSFPDILLFVFVVIGATLFFGLDRGELFDTACGVLPERVLAKMRFHSEIISSTVKAYLKSHFLMMLIVFSVLFVGFSILRIKDAFVIALLVSLVDLLPVLGIGSAMIPWAVIEALYGNTQSALKLLVLLLIVSVVREVVEPKVIGRHMGLHPVIALISVYAGLKLFGILGCVFAPIFVTIVLSVIKKEKQIPDFPGSEYKAEDISPSR